MTTTPTDYPGLTDLPPGPVRVTRDGQPVSPILADGNRAFAWISEQQPQSVSWALRHEGYGVTHLGIEPWPEDVLAALQPIYRRQCAHGHPWRFRDAWDREVTRDNCVACGLDGWGELRGIDAPHGLVACNVAGWERHYVLLSKPVPRRWLAALDAGLNEDTAYAADLARDLASCGLRVAPR